MVVSVWLSTQLVKPFRSSAIVKLRSASPSAISQAAIQGLLEELTTGAVSEGRLRAFLVQQPPLELLRSLPRRDFEARKLVARYLAALLSQGSLLVSEHLVSDAMGLAKALLQQAADQECVAHVAWIIQCCSGCAQITDALLEAGLAEGLLSLALSPQFEVASESLAALRQLLLCQADVAAEYLQRHFQEFFCKYDTLLRTSDYALCRQALKLLAELLTTASLEEVAALYVSEARHLQTHMNLMRSESVVLSCQAFGIFKFFVASPRMSVKVHVILRRNQKRLVHFLQHTFGNKMGNPNQIGDLDEVFEVLRAIRAIRAIGCPVGDRSTGHGRNDVSSL